ncbi:fibroblast growth factor receptor 3-like [Apostichopus japonicus]|uniref:fibroblast growth factor receptor 3-like n=1 Tax=Stichopus japonicus TaxID=307972 RepID=UPI003AB2AB34
MLPLILSGTIFFIAILTALCCLVRRHCNTKRETERRSLDMGTQMTNSKTLQDTTIFDGSVTVDLDVTTDASPTLVRKRQSIMANYKFPIYSEPCVDVGCLFEYRRGNFRTKDRKEHTCFAKSLREICSIEDARNFQRVARSIKSLRIHPHIVECLFISITEFPYTIYYEYLENGSLQNFILARYSEVEEKFSRFATKAEQQFEELLGFSYDIVKGMEFLVSQKFCHPVLCLRKVLLTGDGLCKLYDIRPIDMAIPKVEEELRKKYPPLAWLSPETLFLKEYTSACDVWSYAVLLWEIFSLGKVPHAGLDKIQLEENIRQSNVLNQPSCCPGSIYNMMLTCWSMSAAQRLTFGDIASQLVGTLSDIQKMNEVKEECRQIPTYHVMEMDGYV